MLTDHGAALADVELFEREERTFTISDGTEVHGWLVRDPELTGPRPLLLDVHGGPHNAWNGAADEMHLYHQELAARGWTVLLVNPRGSDGYGEAFYDGVNGAWGVADANDFLEPIDQLVAEGLADPERLAITGYSYGGFMTCYLTAHDDRFAAAVAGGVVSDLVSMDGTCDDGACLSSFELGGTPWEQPERYAAMSPLTRVADVRTPTLVLHGGGDLSCDLGQAQQWHTSLREPACRPSSCSTPSSRTRSSSRPAVAPARLQPPRRRLARAVHRRRRPARASTPPTGSAVSPRSPSATRSPAPSSASCGSRRTVAGRGRHHVLRRAQHRDRGRRPRPTRSSRSARSPRCGRRPSRCSWSTRACSTSTPRSSRCCPSCGSSDPDVTKTVTLRHLLTHTSGIDGDVFTDTGRGDDCLEKYVDLLADAGAEPPARRDLVLLQLRLLADRPRHREGHRHAPGTRRCASGSSRRSA